MSSASNATATNSHSLAHRRGSVSMVPRVVEFYSGLGGMHFALQEAHVGANVVASFDINDVANTVYRHNFPNHTPNQRNIEAVSIDYFERLRGDVFLMSPPCQPYTRTGKQQGSADPRAQSLFFILHLLDVLRHKPCMILLENVKGFEASDSRDAVVATLLRNQYSYREFLITPTQFDIPNSRMRYYLLAKRAPYAFTDEPTYTILSHIPGHHIAGEPPANNNNNNNNAAADTAATAVEGSAMDAAATTTGEGDEGEDDYDDNKPVSKRARMIPVAPTQSSTHVVGDYLENLTQEERAALRVPEKVLWKSGEVFDIVQKNSKHSCCFTKAYNHYAEGSGSVLQDNDSHDKDDMYSIYRTILSTRAKNPKAPWPPTISCPLLNLDLRYFSPREVANLMGFPPAFSFPATVSRKQQYKLLGNSLNVHVVAALISYMWQEPTTTASSSRAGTSSNSEDSANNSLSEEIATALS